MTRGLGAILLLAAGTAGAEEVSYARDLAPILMTRCSGCHAAGVKMGSLDLDSWDAMMAGGTHGSVVAPGRSQESRLYLMLAGKLAPMMPLGASLSAGEIELFQRWIDAGAKPPTAEEAAAIRKATSASRAPEIKPKVAVKPQIFSLAYHPGGQMLAAGGHKDVRLVSAQGKPLETLAGHAGVVRAVAFSRDGKRLAAAGGIAARKGEVKLWDVEKRTVVATFAGHDDCIYAVAFSPDGALVATASYDKLIKLWDAATGNEVRTLKDHIDAVYALAFTPDGKRLVSGGADRTVKIWDPATGARLYTLSDAVDGIQSLALDPAGKRVVAGGFDKTIRIWELGETAGSLIHSLMAHEDAILKLAWSPDSKTIVSSSADRTLKFLRAEDLSEVKALAGQPDWAYGAEFSPDGRTLAVGRYDGSLSLYGSAEWDKPQLAQTKR